MTTHPPLTRFETELLVDLRQHVADRATHRSRTSRPVRRRRLVAAASSVAATAAIAFGALALRPDAAAAFSVQEQSDGDVVVTIHEMSDTDGLEQALAEHGVTAEVSYDPHLALSWTVDGSDPGDGSPWVIRGGRMPGLDDPPADPPQQLSLPPGWPGVDVQPAADGGVTFTLLARCIGPDSVLHLITTGSSDTVLGIFVGWENSAC
jgi:hypothetical protein